MHRAPLTLMKISGTHVCRVLGLIWGHSATDRLGQLQNAMTSTRNEHAIFGLLA
jgi:hypothetical protein